MNIYLAGIIDRKDMAGATNWREHATKFLKEYSDKVKILNPMRGKEKLEYDEMCCGEVVDRDVMDVMNSDLVLAVMNKPKEGTGKIPFGTPCEITIAHLIKHIPVVFVSDSSDLRKHFWVRRFCSRVFDNVDDALKHICNWYLSIPDQDYRTP